MELTLSFFLLEIGDIGCCLLFLGTMVAFGLWFTFRFTFFVFDELFISIFIFISFTFLLSPFMIEFRSEHLSFFINEDFPFESVNNEYLCLSSGLLAE